MKDSKVLLKPTRKFAFISDKEAETFLTQCAKIMGENPKNVMEEITFKQEVYDFLVQILLSFETKSSRAQGKIKLTKVSDNKWKIKWNKNYKAIIEFDFVNNKVNANCSSYDSELKRVFSYDDEYGNFFESYMN